MIDFIKDADCTKETPVKLGVPDAPIYGKGIKLKPRVDGRTDSEHFKKIYLPELLPLEEYDLIVVLISGGKDSVACYLKLLELGVPKERIEFWHHDIDGGHPSRRMDWKCTQNYVKALADAEGIKLRVSYRVNGFFGELYRIGASEPIEWIDPDPAFIVNGQENDVAYLAAFEGSLWDASASAYILDDSQVADFAADMLCSIANAKPLSGLTQNATRANIRKLAEKRGTGWEQGVVQTASASQMLMLIEYATFNMQSVIGNGAVSKTDDGKTSMTENTGATITLGNASGSVVNANGIQIVSYRGEENFWGNIWWWIDGINHYANATTGECETYVADHGFADDIKAAPYEDTGMTAKYGNGYISAFCYSEDFDWLFLPGEFNGNTALPVGDYCWNQNGTGWRVALLGAGWSSGLDAGAFYWSLGNASSGRNRNIGGRLVYRKKVAA